MPFNVYFSLVAVGSVRLTTSGYYSLSFSKISKNINNAYTSKLCGKTVRKARTNMYSKLASYSRGYY